MHVHHFTQKLVVSILGSLTLLSSGAAHSQSANRGSAPNREALFSTLLSFDQTDGQYPDAPLIQGIDGNFYSTTDQGAANGAGEVFKITSTGTLIDMYSFCAVCTEGYAPYAPLVQAGNGLFYGTTAGGGVNGLNGGGTVFTITPWGSLTTLYSFCSQPNCSDGGSPVAGLIQAANGNFYGTTASGGSNYKGTVFEITPEGVLTTLYKFCSKVACADGSVPTAGLVQGTDGNFYGTTSAGGSGTICAPGCGTVFRITPQGSLTTLYNFTDYTDGATPKAGLIQASDGNFYGTTQSGGASQYGAVFKLTPGGVLTTLHSFCSIDGSCPDGREPVAGLVQATDGNFYGDTASGGNTACYAPSGCGTIFKVTPEGDYTTLHTFKSAEGGNPVAALLQATDGVFYGTAQQQGAYIYSGAVFSLSVGLSPFVAIQTASGNAGSIVIILGNNLTGSTGVTFDGAAADFAVISSSEITATVPVGATSGFVVVTTPGGALKSSKIFRVTR
jgi:uncharacterized repeat protein (TIGR03803 family)